MSTLAVANPHPVSRQAWERLLIAFVLSLFLHLALMLGISVNPTGGVPFVTSTIYARLEPTASETPAEAAVEPPLPDVAPSVVPDKSDVTDPLADPVTKKPEPKPEPAAAAPASSPSAGIEVPLIRDPTYYMPSQLDTILTLVFDSPACPEAAKAQRINGQVRLLLLVDEFGIVNEASVIDAEPPGYFEEVTLAAFRAARFSPPQRQGRPVKVRVPSVVTKFVCNPSDVTAR